MAHLIKLDTHSDDRGDLTVIQENLPFMIKRVFYLYNLNNNQRGGHRHHHLTEAVVCLRGSFVMSIENLSQREDFILDSPLKCLVIPSSDFRILHTFSADCLILVLASSKYDKTDYIYRGYPK